MRMTGMSPVKFTVPMAASSSSSSTRHKPQEKCYSQQAVPGVYSRMHPQLMSWPQLRAKRWNPCKKLEFTRHARCRILLHITAQGIARFQLHDASRCCCCCCLPYVWSCTFEGWLPPSPPSVRVHVGRGPFRRTPSLHKHTKVCMYKNGYGRILEPQVKATSYRNAMLDQERPATSPMCCQRRAACCGHA
jgi:hypothetical protein